MATQEKKQILNNVFYNNKSQINPQALSYKPGSVSQSVTPMAVSW